MRDLVCDGAKEQRGRRGFTVGEAVQVFESRWIAALSFNHSINRQHEAVAWYEYNQDKRIDQRFDQTMQHGAK